MTKLFKFQRLGVESLRGFGGRALLADEMGCIGGDAIITVNRGGNARRMSLRSLYRKFHNLEGNWNLEIPTFTRSLCNGELRKHRIRNVLDKGTQPVLQITLESGKSLLATPDHEICQRDGMWTRADRLLPGDTVLTNGKPACANCKTDKGIVTYPYSKFVGYCRKCVYRYLRNNRRASGKFLDSDGYVRVSGCQDHPRANPTGQVYEHILIMEEILGRGVHYPLEHIHHKDGNRSNNHPENLQLVSPGEHHKIHNRHRNFPLFIPTEDRVTSVTPAGETDTYDIVMEDPHRNFIANGIIIHNCGKTIQSLAFLRRYRKAIGTLPAIVVCPAFLKLNWQREARKHVGMESVICYGKAIEPWSLPWDRNNPPDLVIINYDILSKWVEYLQTLKPRTIIIDEAHSVRERSRQKTKAVRELCQDVPYVIGLSGTPITSRPIEFWSILNIIRPDIYPSYHAFGNRYCGPKRTPWGIQYKGATRLEELNSRLLEDLMVRRTKAEVLQELPEITRSVIPLELTKNELREYSEALDECKQWFRDNPKRGGEALVRLGVLKRKAAALKLPQILNWVDEFLSEGSEKLVLFGIHKRILETFRDRYGKQAVYVTGEVSTPNRQKAVDAFQTDRKVRLFIGNIQAAGVGITLTKAKTLAFVELGWTPGEHSQAESRIHRIGQHDGTTCYYFVAHQTIEEQLCDLLQQKQEVLDMSVDGELSENLDIMTQLERILFP